MSTDIHFTKGKTQDSIPDLSPTAVASIMQLQTLAGYTNAEQRERAINLAQQQSVKVWPFVILAGILLGFILYWLVTQ